MTKNPVKEIDVRSVDEAAYDRCFAACLVITHDLKILLQQRGEQWSRFPGSLALFGGEIDAGESADQGVVRELNEELGALVNLDDAVLLGAFTKPEEDSRDLIYAYFWHDKDQTINGCYEGEPRYFDTVDDILNQQAILSGIPWVLNKAKAYIRDLMSEKQEGIDDCRV